MHADLNWRFGPFRYLIASPVFHRWHHTGMQRGGMKNFTATFPVIDLIFGTYCIPKGALPDAYGIGEPEFPRSFGRQLLYLFVAPKGTAGGRERRRRRTTGSAAGHGVWGAVRRAAGLLPLLTLFPLCSTLTTKRLLCDISYVT